MEGLYQQIIESYKETGSVKETADRLGTYPIKVRRVLITEGLWKSKTSERIVALYEAGKSVSEIAKVLIMSEKNVQSYLPYSRGQYGGEARSDEALRSEAYRERMQTAAKNQVTKTEACRDIQEDELSKQKRLLEELLAEKNRLIEEQKLFWDNIETEMKRIPRVMQLHLELDLGYFDVENKQILQKYGRMKEGISRDFLVPGCMTLHGLHYAIMKAFGWQNSHLHSYVPYEEDFKNMTDGGLVKEWTRQVGMYFRFPSDNYDDIYWDDDYEENESFKTWLKSRYCGPYYYDGVGEHYAPAQIEVDQFRKDWPAIQKKTTDQRTWNVYMEGRCEELLERIQLSSLLRSPSDQQCWEEWRQKKEESLLSIEKERKAILKEYKKTLAAMDKIADVAESYFDANGKPTIDMIPFFETMRNLEAKLASICECYDPDPIPVLSALKYCYDYGDGWEIKITCTNAWYDRSDYSRDECGNMQYEKYGFAANKYLYVDAFEQAAEGEYLEILKRISEKEKPVCIAWDGMSLVDDVGGISGFCEFLETINGNDQEKRKQYKEWARSLGWTGRMPKPENML